MRDSKFMALAAIASALSGVAETKLMGNAPIKGDYSVIPPYGRKRVKRGGNVIWSGGTYVKAIHGPIGSKKAGKS